MHVRKGDLVEVISGEDRGKRASVIRAVPKDNQVVVEKVNVVYRHLRRSRKNPQGGRLEVEAPIDACKVLLVCPTCNRGVRTGRVTKDDGSKVRVCRKCSKELGRIS